MKRLVCVTLVLCAALAGAAGAALAQDANGPVVVDDASGTSGTSGVSGTCTSSGPPGDRVILCSDLRPGNGLTVIEAPPKSSSAPEEAPAPEPAAAAPETTDRAVASDTDRDADNAPDDLEPSLGLDPTNPDTDGDGVADGDESNIYGTDPLAFDTDGDGLGDGEELFGSYTDPLVPNTTGAQDTGASG